MANEVKFNLELAVRDFNRNLNKVDKSLNSFHQDFRSDAKKSSQAWNVFAGNVASNAFSFAAQGLTNLVSGLADFTVASVRAAVDAQETASKFEAVFSTISEESATVASELQRNYGLGITESKNLLSATGDLLTGFGFAQDSALKLSGEVQKLSVDLASFTNYSGGAAGASEAITKALLGEREALKQLGVSVQERDVLAQVQINRAAGITFETERQAKAQATLDLIIQQSGNAIGDYAKTSGGAANQLKLFNKLVEDISIAFGENLIPVLEPVLLMTNEWLRSLDLNKVNSFVVQGLAGIVGGFTSILELMNPIINSFTLLGNTGKLVFNGLSSQVASLGIVFEAMAIQISNMFLGVLNSLPDSIVPDGWKEKLEAELTVQEERFASFKDQLALDSADAEEALNGILNPENMFTEEEIEIILGRVNTLKEGILKERDTTDLDQVNRDKAEAARQKKLDAEAKKRQEKMNKDKLKQSEFEEVLFGKQLSWEESGGKQRADNLKSTMATMATYSESGNSELAQIGKAAAISMATIDGIAAVQKALASAPPPFNFALAGIVGTATALNVSKMAGVKFETGGIVPGASFTGDSIHAQINSGEMILNRGQQATLFNQINNGTGGSNESVIEAINNLGNRIATMEIVLQADDTEIARSASRGVQNGVIIGENR